MKSLSKRQERTKDIDMEKINGKWEAIILQKTTHHTTRSGDTENSNKKKCKNLHKPEDKYHRCEVHGHWTCTIARRGW
jgi:hypothetical protein